jgi:outer membrane receptor protein involved in Fe transport
VSLFSAIARSPGFVDLRQRPDGTWPANPFGNSNPLQTAALVRNIERVYRYIGSGSGTYTPLRTESQEVRLLVNGGADFFNQRTDLFSPPELQFEPQDGLPGTSILGNAQNLNVNLNLNAVHVYRRGAGATLSATSSVGYQFERRGLSTAQIVSQGLIGGLQNVSRATAIAVNQDIALTKDVGFFAQEELLFRERLLLTAGFRADRSGNNSDTEKFYFFPKASASYRFSGLPLAVDELKLRAAFGQSGNQPLYGQKFTEYAAANIVGIPSFNVGGQAAANDVRPERQREIEGGLDLTTLRGRATFELTGYEKTITDLLLTRTPAISSGYAVQIFNGGSIRTRGLEAGLRALLVQGRGFDWVSNTTFSMERSKALSLPVPPFRPPSFGTQAGAFQVEAGKSLGQIIGTDSLPDGTIVTRAVAEAIPTFRMGFSNTFRYRALSMFALADWQQGGITSNRQRFFYDLNQASVDCAVRAPEPNPLNESVCRRRNRLYAKQTAIYLEDATFLKVRELSLTLEVPPQLAQRATSRVESARLSLSGRNLLWFTGYTGFDPEASNFGSQAISRNIDSPGFPPARSVWFSIDVTF